MSNTKPNLTNLSLFLILNQVKWECKNNTVERSFEDGIFIIKVTGKTEDKNFSISIDVERENDIKLHVPGMMAGYTINDIGNLLDGIRQSGAISPSVFAKYQESLELVGIPQEIRETCSVNESAQPNALEEAFANFIKLEDVVRSWTIVMHSRHGEYNVDVAQIQDEHDNTISGRYTLFCHWNKLAIDLEVSPENLLTTTTPIDSANFIAEYLPARDPKESNDTDFKRIIGNEKPHETEQKEEPEDKTKYLFPYSEKLILEDIVSIILDECNNKLNLHTVVTNLDFNADAYRIAITSPNRTWLNLILAEKDGLVYLNYVLTNPTANFNHAIKIDETRTLATVGATYCNISLVRALVQNFVMASPIVMGFGSAMVNASGRASSGFDTGGRRETSQEQGFTGQRSEPSRDNAVTAESFVNMVSSIYFECNQRMGNRGYKSRWDALNELMLISGLDSLTHTDTVTVISLLPKYGNGHCSVYDLYKIIKAIRPQFEVKGSLPTDFVV